MTATSTPTIDPASTVSPRGPYEQRLAQRRGTLDSKVRLERRIADARLTVFVFGVVLAGFTYLNGSIAWWWISIPIFFFAGIVVLHEQTRRAVHRASRAAEYYELGVKRIDGTWLGQGASGKRYLAADHLYAADLDIFGIGSVFERICTARTRSGEDTLASWFLAPAPPSTILERQAAIDELRPRIDLREDLILLGSDVQEGIDPDSLSAWGRQSADFTSSATPIVAKVLAVLTTLSVIAWVTFSVTDSVPSEYGTIPSLSLILIELAFLLKEKSRIRRVIGVLQRRTHDLVLLGQLLSRLEREPFQTPALARLNAALSSEGLPASRQVARLARLVQLLEAKDNQFFAPFAVILMWTPLLAIAIDRWRVHTGPAITGWLAAVGEFEALCSLAAYAFENPDDPFPEIERDEVVFEGHALGHPLLPLATCVRNDVRLGGELRVLLVSGSNMSGKSTLLRTVGVNTVLALAGAPVRAHRLRLSLLSIGSTLRIQDSLQEGKSRFYAEITRVREIVERARGPIPLLFTLDEIFHGTNSHDRAVGALAIVRGLIDLGAIGLVTTHDLALADAALTLAPRVANVHFEDQLVDGVMRFDYTMRPGVITHSNALALMRAVGLDV